MTGNREENHDISVTLKSSVSSSDIIDLPGLRLQDASDNENIKIIHKVIDFRLFILLNYLGILHDGAMGKRGCPEYYIL